MTLRWTGWFAGSFYYLNQLCIYDGETQRHTDPQTGPSFLLKAVNMLKHLNSCYKETRGICKNFMITLMIPCWPLQWLWLLPGYTHE